MKAIVDGQTVTVGDWVSFKADCEQSGQIIEIKSTYMGQALVLENKSGFHGDYIGCLLYTSPSPRDRTRSRMPSSA